jgi:hypothetical protein
MAVVAVPRAPGRTAVLTVVGRMLALAAAAAALAAVHLRHRPATLCLFREVTGLPCPFCGGTTAMVRLGHGDLGGALSASPLALAMVAAWPFVGVVHRPAWATRRLVRGSVVAALIAAETYQLFRFHIL